MERNEGREKEGKDERGSKNEQKGARAGMIDTLFQREGGMTQGQVIKSMSLKPGKSILLC